MNFKPLVTKEELAQGYQILRELRKDLSFETFEFIHQKASLMDDYTLIGGYLEEKLVAVMGYRIQYDFVRGKYLYIDDLVTSESVRSMGLGAKMLAHAETIAKKQECSVLRLCAHVDNLSGQKFYDREKWDRRAIVFIKRITL